MRPGAWLWGAVLAALALAAGLRLGPGPAEPGVDFRNLGVEGVDLAVDGLLEQGQRIAPVEAIHDGFRRLQAGGEFGRRLGGQAQDQEGHEE